MMQKRVYELFHKALVELEETMDDVIDEAAWVVFDRIVAGGAAHIYDTGHLVDRELVHRAGGLALWRPLRWTLEVENPVRQRREKRRAPDVGTIIRCVLDASRVARGDVLVIGSVSGASETVVELARAARERGVFVIAVTSPAYSRELESSHASGKRLFQVADLVIDNGAPYGDAALAVEGLKENIVPVSGIGAVTALWALSAGIVQRLIESGRTPSVYASVNRPDTRDFNERSEERYERHGW